MLKFSNKNKHGSRLSYFADTASETSVSARWKKPNFTRGLEFADLRTYLKVGACGVRKPPRHLLAACSLGRIDISKARAAA